MHDRTHLKTVSLRAGGPRPLALQLALMMGAAGSDTDLLAAALRGIDIWRAHSFSRAPSGAPVHLTLGAARLYRYGTTGAPVLLVPSLVNPSYILDLLPGNSLIAYLSAQGFSPFLLDWGEPGAREASFTLSDYVDRIVETGLHLSQDFGTPPALLGYCMGGTLSLAAALLKPQAFKSLALLAAPWDFHAGDGTHRALASASLPFLPAITAQGMALPALAQSFFAMLSPRASLEKYAALSKMDPESDRVRLFVAVEDWVNGGAPLAGPVAIDILRDWYLLNLPGRGCWSLSGMAIHPQDVRLPVFAAVPMADRIVPPESALGCTGGLVADRLVRPDAGHVGMIVGGHAKDRLWRPLADWLSQTV